MLINILLRKKERKIEGISFEMLKWQTRPTKRKRKRQTFHFKQKKIWRSLPIPLVKTLKGQTKKINKY